MYLPLVICSESVSHLGQNSLQSTSSLPSGPVAFPACTCDRDVFRSLLQFSVDLVDCEQQSLLLTFFVPIHRDLNSWHLS